LAQFLCFLLDRISTPKTAIIRSMGDNSQYHPNYATAEAGDGYAITTDFYGMFGVPFGHFSVGR
jgi:hypothetical protein